MKNFIIVAVFLLILGNCATAVVLKENIQSKTNNLNINVLKLTDGPDSFASGGRNFSSRSKENRLIHITVNFTNQTKSDYTFVFSKIILEPSYETLIEDKGKEVKKMNPPAFVRHFEVGFANDIKEDTVGNNFVLGQVEKEIVIKPNETMTRTLIYILPKNVEPEKLILLDEKSHSIPLK